MNKIEPLTDKHNSINVTTIHFFNIYKKKKNSGLNIEQNTINKIGFHYYLN